MSELLEFRKKYPFRPNEVCILRGADDKVLHTVEVISYPWEENGYEVPRVKIRLTPGDSGTLGETEVDNLFLYPKVVDCQRHPGQPFQPVVAYYPKNDPLADKVWTRAITCHICGRRYFLATKFTVESEHFDHKPEDIGKWLSDRELKIIEVGPKFDEDLVQ